jgi:hypothetical protein
MNEIVFDFEALPLGGYIVPDGLRCQLEITASGRATIGYDENGWVVTAIDVDAGAHVLTTWVSRHAPIGPKNMFFDLIATALREYAADEIESLILDDLKDRGVFESLVSEHSTLNHNQQGLSR